MKRLLFVAAWLLILQTTAWAGPHWHALSTEQRQALAPLEGRWQQLESQDREIWAQLALRYPSLSAPEQQRMRERMLAWADLPAAERERARRAHARAQRLSADDRQARWEQYQGLPAERRRELQERAEARRTAGTPPTLADRKALDEHTLLPRRAASAP